MERATCVRIRKAANSSREYDTLTVRIADLTLSCDLVNDRQIRLANRLAVSHGAELRVSDELQERVQQVLDARSSGEPRALLSADDSNGNGASHVIGSDHLESRWDSNYAKIIQRIEQPHTLAELQAKIDSGDYGAEMLLQHAMRLLTRGVTTGCAYPNCTGDQPQDGGCCRAPQPQQPGWFDAALALLNDIRKDVRESKFGSLQCDTLEDLLREAAHGVGESHD